MGQGRTKKYNKLIFGFITGIFLPLFIFLLIFAFRYNEISLSDYIMQLWNLKIIFKILSLCAFANILLFFLFNRLKMSEAMKGIIMATLLFALLFVVFGLF